MKNEINYLRMCDHQIRGLQCHDRDSERLEYLRSVVRPDILTRISEEDLVAYTSEANAVKVLSAEDIRKMEMNKDSESI